MNSEPGRLIDRNQTGLAILYIFIGTWEYNIWTYIVIISQSRTGLQKHIWW